MFLLPFFLITLFILPFLGFLSIFFFGFVLGFKGVFILSIMYFIIFFFLFFYIFYFYLYNSILITFNLGT